MFSFKWPDKLTSRFLHERITARHKFPQGQRNNLVQYQKIVEKLNIQTISAKQAQSKWQNLLYRYKELKKLQLENKIVAKDNWIHYNQIDAFFEGRYEIDPMFEVWSNIEIDDYTSFFPDEKKFIQATSTTESTALANVSSLSFDISESTLGSADNILISKDTLSGDDTSLSAAGSKRIKEDELMYILPTHALQSVENDCQLKRHLTDEEVFGKFVSTELTRIRDMRIRENAKWEIQCAIRKAITNDLDKFDECADIIES